MAGEGVPIGVIGIGTPGTCICARGVGMWDGWLDGAYRDAR